MLCARGKLSRQAIGALSEVDPALLDELLSSLVRKEVLTVRADKLSPERGQYTFTQSLIRSVAYNMLTRAERKARHSLLGKGETMSFRAEDTSTGRSVLVHQFLREQTSARQPDLMSMVYAYLPGTGTPGTEHFLDSGEEEDRVFIVTADVQECLDLRGWLQSIAASRGITTPASPQSAQSQPASSDLDKTQVVANTPPTRKPLNPLESLPDPDEFEILFSSLGGQPKPPESSLSKDDVPRGPATPAVPLAASGAEKGPGELGTFGRDIAVQKAGPPVTPQRPGTKPEPAIKPPGKPPRGQVPSGFEVVFSSRKQPSRGGPPRETNRPTNVPPPPESTKAAGSGELDQIFSAMNTGKDEPLPAKAPLTPGIPPSTPPPPITKEGPGEFTQMFSGMGKRKVEEPPAPAPLTPGKAPSVPPPPITKEGPGEFTQMFAGMGKRKVEEPPAETPLTPGKAPSVPPQPIEEETRGEFTRMFQASGKGKVDQPPDSSPPPGSVPIAPSLQPAAEKGGLGEFTQIFNTSQAKTEPPAAPPLSTGVIKPSAPPPVSSTQKGPSEFTLMFNANARAPSQPEPPQKPSQWPSSTPPAGADSRGFASPPQPPAPLPGASKKGPGELTLMMQGYKPPAATPAAPVLEPPKPSSPPPAAQPGKKQPGEFTMLFQSPPQPVAPVPPAAAPPPAIQPAPPPSKRQPGEYTGIFEAPQFPPAPPQAVPQAAPPAGYGYPAVPVAAPPPPVMPQMPVYQAPPSPMAPQMAYPQPAMPQYQPPPMPQMQPMGMPAMQPMPTKKPAIFWVLVLGLGGLFLIAVVLILFFALKH